MVNLTSRQHTRAFYQVVAAFMLSQFMLALAMAASPELHHYLHHDSDDDDHDCAVTHLINGDFSDGLPALPVAVTPVNPERELMTTDTEWTPAWVPPLYLASFTLERAPPLAV